LTDTTIQGRQRGATRVAISALAWTALLAGAKTTVGVLTGSVAVLGDGLHSILDVVVAGVTLFAVRLSGKPPDREHPYGHGRVENLAALGEAFVMFIVGAGVGAEAVRRIVNDAEITAPVYAIAVTAAALVIGAWRSRVLRRAAARFSSPALQADALNMTADVGESLAVLIGLGASRLGFPAGDPIAALIVVATMWVMAGRIGWAAVNVLMDRVPPGLHERVAAAARGVSGVADVGDLRVRESGPNVHAEVNISVGRTASVERSHEITEAVEAAVANAVPGATATVHVEPSIQGEDFVARTFAAANRLGLADQVHNVLAIRHPEGLWLMLHAKVPASTPLADAHAITDELEREIRKEIPALARVEIHVEPHEPPMMRGSDVGTERARLTRDVQRVAERHDPITRCHEVAISEAEDGLHLVLHCEAPGGTTIGEIHDASLRIEDEIHRRHDEVRSITVHFEPQGLS
jgi:cation diffusion facilitator family transporter